MFKLHIYLFALLTFLFVVRADYTIDDSDYSVLKFSENPSGPVWGPFGSDTGEELQIRLPNGTMQTIDSAQCFDGSGITIYVLQAGPQGMSASLSIDSGSATTATLPAPPAPQYNIPHVTLFNVQNLPSGTHTAVMTVQDWNGGFSGMMLDYIDVNQAVVAAPSSNSPTPSPPPSPSPTPSSTSAAPQTSSQASTSSASSSQSTSGSSVASVASIISVQTNQTSTASSPSSTSGSSSGAAPTSSSSPKKTNVAAIAGGVVGGVLGLLGLCALAFFCFRRRRRSQPLDDSPNPLLRDPEPRFTNAASANPFAAAPAVSMSRPSGGSRPLQAWTESDAASTSNLASGEPLMSSPTNLTRMAVTSSGAGGSVSSTRSPAISAASPAGVDNSARDVMDVSAAASPLAAAAAALPQESPSPAPAPLRPLPAPVDASTVYPNEKLRQSLSNVSRSSTQRETVPGAANAPANPVLTDDQADFVNSLFNNNVPAPVVARVLERMLANPQGPGPNAGPGTGANDPELRAHLGTDGLGAAPASQITQGQHAAVMAWLGAGASEMGDGETTLGTAPPSYDFVRAQ
ncbi:hypothetical protein HYDPIDRAFT_29564 [Hydnomerulius pinastri MD-312]|uniref:Mid2 domain-containing protein n=1 Tax=Hydnomerulius pinastri MD-312 TaxID=994086 RepID=A0A0C9WDS1_9AGAM|nr:hypothetical protein HYDPIDRAFT_29564 [Hydnomerulius pinastri MD-312]